jgi:hypothetical protein
MTVVAYTSRVRIERLGGPERLAYLPAEEEPAAFGVHSEVAEHHGRKPRRLPMPPAEPFARACPPMAPDPAPGELPFHRR